MTFELTRQSGHARAGQLSTPHADVRTPCFMPVATQAAVKSLSPQEVSASGAQMLIMNTYHLWLRPGAESVSAHGGLHGFSRWSGAIATDSGGYQAFSLAERTKLSEAGFEFSSHLDGTRCLLSPEESMRVQGLLASDIAMPLDVCPSVEAGRADLVEAVERTTRWLDRCLAARVEGQALFGIVQGGLDLDLRRSHARQVEATDVEGIALGGFSVGESMDEMHRLLGELVPHIDPARPRYLMGVGRPEDLVRAIAAGVDLFDCVLPTRNARNGQVFTRFGKLVIKNSRFKNDLSVLDETCRCPVCTAGYTRAYLRHLFVAGEILALRLLSQHNLHYYQQVVREAREAVLRDAFEGWQSETLSRLRGSGELAV